MFFFSFLNSDFAHFLGQLVSIIVKTLRNTNLGASRCFKMKKNSLPVDVRRSKTPLLKLPSISRANGERRSPIEKHVVVSVRSNLPQKSSTVLSEPKFGSPQSKIPGNASCLYPRRRYSTRRQKEKGTRNYIQWPCHRKGTTKNSFPWKICCCFYLLAFHILSTTLDTS